MDYKKLIDPELRKAAKKIPYNKFLIRCANIYQPVAFYLARVPTEVANRSITIGGYNGSKLKINIFEPQNAKGKLPCLIYVHGGAFSYKASAYHKKLACAYAARAKCRIYFPDYHLLPQCPYPAAYEDVLALYRWIMVNAETCGIDIKKIGIAGDSAGAALAALLCNHYEQNALERPCAQMLVYPVLDVDMQTASMKNFTDAPLWNTQNHKRMWLYYFKGMDADKLCDAVPMRNSLPQTIPDTYIETAEYDCLHDEGILYGKKLRKAGACVEINETKGTFHGYDSAITTQIAARSIDRRISFLKKRFHGGSPV